MAEEHPFDRYTNATTEEQRCRERVEELVASFQSIANRLRHWQELGFCGQLSDGGPVVDRGSRYVVGFTEQPSLEQIHFEICEWKKACTEIHRAKLAMTHKQRESFGLSLD